ncbi:MAG: hypothetical protein ACRC3B_00580, partial [Bacteroidia bacterium]
MKLLQLLSALLLTGALHGQYFQSVYGGSGSGCDVLEDGTPTQSGQTGHLMVGHTDAYMGITGVVNMSVVRTDQNGLISGASAFNQVYKISTGQLNHSAHPVEIMHTANDRILVAGSLYNTNGSSNIYLAVANSSGNFFSCTGFTGSLYNRLIATTACLSTFNSAHVFIAGYADLFQTGQAYPVLLCFDWQNNTVVWSHIFDFRGSLADMNIPKNIMCSPYSNEVVITGDAKIGTVNDIFFCKADANTGDLNMLNLSSGSNFVAYYDGRGGYDEVTGLTTGSSTSGGALGFVVCGNSNFGLNNASLETMLFKVDNDGNRLWINRVRYGNGAAEVSDVAERLNTTGNYEYFLTGQAAIGYASSDADILVFKCDDAGNGIEEYTIDDALGQDGISIGLVDNTATDGLAIYGRELSAQYTGFGGDFRMAKMYYNGALNCNENVKTPISDRKYLSVTSSSYNDMDVLSQQSYSVTPVGPYIMVTLCSSTSISWGNNTREANQGSDIIPGFSVSPNPVSSATNHLQLSTHLEQATEIQVEILAVDGRLIEAVQL